MARKCTEEIGMNMTPMIDCVFQLIIFFVVTVDLDRTAFNQSIVLSKSPNGPAIVKKDPRTIMIEVDEKGRVLIGQTQVGIGFLTAVLTKAVGQYGQSTPVQIRADRKTRHESVRQVMEACGVAGLWRVSFVAMKEEAEKAGGRGGG